MLSQVEEFKFACPFLSVCQVFASEIEIAKNAANSWNLSVARQIKTMNTIVEVSGKNEFPRCFSDRFFFPCFVQAFGVTHLHMLVLSG